MSETHQFVEHLFAQARKVEGGGVISGSELANTLKELAALEVEEGGPYAHDGTPDLATNLAIACFLAVHNVRLPKLDAFIENAGSAETPLEESMLEHLMRYRAQTESQETDLALSEGEGRVLENIRAAATKRFLSLSDELRDNAVEVIERTIAGNHDTQMSLMAYHVRQALGTKGEQFDDALVAELGLANICFWTAFIVYDDFWDEDEAAEPRLLPTANLFARHYTDFFTHLLPEETGFRTFFQDVMDALDAANTWEMHFCRMKREGTEVFLPEQLPLYGEDFDIKFYPAAGHVFGPVAMFLMCGQNMGSPDVKNLIAYFKHYLIAMQLNDDAHDWKEDLERGHISTAVALLLHRWRDMHPERNVINLESDMPELEQLFWFHALGPICESVLSHTRRSRDALSSLSLVEDPTPLDRFIVSNERIAWQALKEQATSEEFLRAFS